MTDSLSIEGAESESQISAVRELYRQYYEELLNIDTDINDFENEIMSLPGNYEKPDGRLLLASNENRDVVGCVAFKKIDEIICEMKRLYILPQFRSRGYSRKMLEVLISEAVAEGYKMMRLDTLESLHAANVLYKSFGFSPCPPFGDESPLDLLYFSLDLRKSGIQNQNIG